MLSRAQMKSAIEMGLNPAAAAGFFVRPGTRSFTGGTSQN
jgi:hypothetical protein